MVLGYKMIYWFDRFDWLSVAHYTSKICTAHEKAKIYYKNAHVLKMCTFFLFITMKGVFRTLSNSKNGMLVPCCHLMVYIHFLLFKLLWTYQIAELVLF